MNRINRVTSILIQLQSKKIIPAKEIAQRFNISLRTVYRDIRTLEEAGIPIGSEAGKGYFLVEGFLLPPVMFTAAEVGALITAGKFLNCHGDESFIKDFDSAMNMPVKVIPNRYPLLRVQRSIIPFTSPNTRVRTLCFVKHPLVRQQPHRYLIG